MKNRIMIWVGLLSFLILITACGSSQRARIGVGVRPNAPIMTRPVPPSRSHVWIDGNWIWRNNAYIYQQGYWAPPRRRQQYQSGYWIRTKHGYQWKSGFWHNSRRR